MKRFWNKVKIQEGLCWEWQGALRTNGYGCFKYKGKTESAHRIVWLITYGEVPVGLWVLHKCDNRKCVNPSHLFLGNRSVNMKDCYDKGRMALPDHIGKPSSLRKVGEKGLSWCRSCRKFLPVNQLVKSKRRWNGLDKECKKCKKERRKT